MNLDEWRELLGWCSLINFALLLFSALALACLHEQVARIHSRLLGLPTEALKPKYFAYLAQYKLLVIVFNFVPYLALVLMSGS